MNDFYSIAIPLLVGFILDLIIGDPYKLPHPIRIFGNAIYYFESKLNKGTSKIVKGVFLTVLLVAGAWFMFYSIIYIIQWNQWIYYLVTSILVFYGLANRNLVDEAKKVEMELTNNGVEAGRKQLSFIVGRDTSNLNSKKIRTAVLETLSENLSDGVIAPMFYYAIGGVPFMFAYKMVNTLDSMIGYKNERYKKFGFFAAKLDDLANYIPARITAFLIAILGFNWRAFRFIFLYGSKHASPNAGYPEAALAGVLNCRFGGPNIYYGVKMDKPYIGEEDRDVDSEDIRKACWINIAASLLFLFTILLLLFFLVDKY